MQIDIDLGDVAQINSLRIILNRNGSIKGWNIRYELVRTDWSVTRGKQGFPKKQFGEMRPVMAELIEELVNAGVPRWKIKTETNGIVSFMV